MFRNFIFAGNDIFCWAHAAEWRTRRCVVAAITVTWATNRSMRRVLVGSLVIVRLVDGRSVRDEFLPPSTLHPPHPPSPLTHSYGKSTRETLPKWKCRAFFLQQLSRLLHPPSLPHSLRREVHTKEEKKRVIPTFFFISSSPFYPPSKKTSARTLIVNDPSAAPSLYLLLPGQPVVILVG